MRSPIACVGRLFLLAWPALATALPGAEPPLPHSLDATLAERLATLDARLAPPDDPAAFVDRLDEEIQSRLHKQNAQSTAQWAAIRTLDDWRSYRDERLRRLRQSLGEFPPVPAKLEVHRTGSLAGEGFEIDNLLFLSRPGLWVTANLYRPADQAESAPGILICHSHHTPKENGELQDMGMTWARAGCLVLVMDQLGHGERRQHPFVDAAAYPTAFRVSRQDYYFRYDVGMQLHLVGESLIGWMAWDMMRGVDLLLTQPGIDPQRIILLGAVAGGGDPAAVTAALDDRIAAAVPFNFGGPQPESPYPLPDDAETTFDYAGGGSWESTRNLRRSAADGFLPWAIVAGIPPRRLVYAHEFSWDRPRDPVFKRLEAIYTLHGAGNHLAFTHGAGTLTGESPKDTHCTHIGHAHRRMIHDAFRRWFGIEVSDETEYSRRVPPDQLRCMTLDATHELRPRPLYELLTQLAAERLARARESQEERLPAEYRRLLREALVGVLGDVEPGTPRQSRTVSVESVGDVTLARVVLSVDDGIEVPLLLLTPQRQEGKTPPLVVAVCQAGKSALLRERAAEVASLLESGTAVCLPDLRGTGEVGWGDDRGRTSLATAMSSTQLMLGETTLGMQLRDLRSILAWIRTRGDLDAGRLGLWGESLATANSADAVAVVPRDDDAALPTHAEPLGGLLVLLASLYDEGVQAVFVRGGLASYHSVLAGPQVLIPHDALVPGLLAVCDVADLAAALAPLPLQLEQLVDGRNVPLGKGRSPIAQWFAERL